MMSNIFSISYSKIYSVSSSKLCFSRFIVVCYNAFKKQDFGNLKNVIFLESLPILIKTRTNPVGIYKYI